MPNAPRPPVTPVLPPFRHRRDLACVTTDDPDLFYDGDQDAARALCERCPARKACLRWAIGADLDFGIVAGYDPAERRAIRREWDRRRQHAAEFGNIPLPPSDAPTRPDRVDRPWGWPQAAQVDKKILGRQFAAAHDYVASGGDIRGVVTRHGVPKTRIWEAATVVRYAPYLEADVVGGWVPFGAALRHARDMRDWAERNKADAA